MKILLLIAEFILRIIAKTWRININGEFPDAPAVIAFWHCNMLSIWKIFSNKNSFAIVSLHKDGEILAKLLKKWKYNLVRGSSTNNGANVIERVVNEKSNSFFLITPDGPRGPRMKCKAGAFVIAQRKNIPYYFVTAQTKHKIIFSKSWDKFELPLPFSKIIINFSTQNIISSTADKSAISNAMQKCGELFGIDNIKE